MRKRLCVAVFLLGLIPYTVNASSGGIPAGKHKTTAPAVKRGKISEAERARRAQEALKSKEERARKLRREKTQALKDSLNNTEWKVEVALVPKGKKSPDAVLFKEGKVSFEKQAKEGFTPTNYTLTVQDNESLVWETMKTSEKGQVCFIRGEISPDGETMKGIISYPKDGGTKDYSFTSTGKQKIE